MLSIFMMNRNTSLFLFTLLVLCMMPSCKDKKGKSWYFDQPESTGAYDSHPIAGDTTVVNDHRPVADFEEIEISDAAIVNIHIGPPCRVTVNGQKAYADAQHVRVSDGVLSARFDDDMSRHHKTSLNISAPSLKAVRLHNVQHAVLDGQDNRVPDFEVAFKRVVMAHFNSPIKAERVTVNIEGMTYGNFYIDCSQLKWHSSHISHAKVTGNIGKADLHEEPRGSVELVRP